MKSFIVAFILVASLGAVAAKTVQISKVGAMPTPMCPPDDPNACGFR